MGASFSRASFESPANGVAGRGPKVLRAFRSRCAQSRRKPSDSAPPPPDRPPLPKDQRPKMTPRLAAPWLPWFGSLAAALARYGRIMAQISPENLESDEQVHQGMAVLERLGIWVHGLDDLPRPSPRSILAEEDRLVPYEPPSHLVRHYDGVARDNLQAVTDVALAALAEDGSRGTPSLRPLQPAACKHRGNRMGALAHHAQSQGEAPPSGITDHLRSRGGLRGHDPEPRRSVPRRGSQGTPPTD